MKTNNINFMNIRFIFFKKSLLFYLFILFSDTNFAQKRSPDGYLFTPDLLNTYCKARDLEEIYSGKNIEVDESTRMDCL